MNFWCVHWTPVRDVLMRFSPNWRLNMVACAKLFLEPINKQKPLWVCVAHTKGVISVCVCVCIDACIASTCSDLISFFFNIHYNYDVLSKLSMCDFHQNVEHVCGFLFTIPSACKSENCSPMTLIHNRRNLQNKYTWFLSNKTFAWSRAVLI